MNSAMLSCRICEATHPLAPLSSCDACSGPLDVRYVWGGSRGALDDPGSLWSRGALLPHRDTALPSPTPTEPSMSPCRTIIQRTLAVDAPSAMRTPSSRVRCVTKYEITP